MTDQDAFNHAVIKALTTTIYKLAGLAVENALLQTQLHILEGKQASEIEVEQRTAVTRASSIFDSYAFLDNELGSAIDIAQQKQRFLEHMHKVLHLKPV